MTEREVLELAAKAMGQKVVNWAHDGSAELHPRGGDWWNPLHNDADAFRLIVRFGMQIHPGYVSCHVGHAAGSIQQPYPFVDGAENPNVDAAAAALRAAVTSVAALIGQSMP